MPDDVTTTDFDFSDDPLEAIAQLDLGPPFAIAGNCALLERAVGPKGAVQCDGCIACIQCEGCGKNFRINLLSSAKSHVCPNAKCGVEYTSVLLITTTDDSGVLGDAFEQILAANGIRLPNPEGDDESGDAEGDDGADESDDEPEGDDGDESPDDAQP